MSRNRKLGKSKERENRGELSGSGSGRTIYCRRVFLRPGPERLFPADTDPPLLPSLPGSVAPVTSLESRGQQQPQCPLVSSLHLAAVTGRHWTVPSLQKWSSVEFYSVIQILILTHVNCTMVIENSIRTRLSEIVNLNLFKSSENNNVRKSSQSKHNQKLVTNPSEETFVSNQSTAKLLKVINIIKH